MTTFSDWLVNAMREREMTAADLARGARKSSAVISRILSGERNPAPDTVQAIAHALRLPPEVVYRNAGMLPPKSPDDESADVLYHRILNLPDVLRAQAEDYVNYLAEKHGNSDRTATDP
jgi:transcriptional regulator with XRE-family HTH domain